MLAWTGYRKFSKKNKYECKFEQKWSVNFLNKNDLSALVKVHSGSQHTRLQGCFVQHWSWRYDARFDWEPV